MQGELAAARAVVLLDLAQRILAPDRLWEGLLADADPVVRELAQRRWPVERR